MPRVRAIKSFIWNLRAVDLHEEFDVSERDAFLLVHGYGHAVLVEGETPLAMPGAMVVHGDPVVDQRDPVVASNKRRRT